MRAFGLTITILMGFIVIFCTIPFGYSAVVHTSKGMREGRVIVRKSPDRLVVTILTQEKRLFQFYARDIDSVTASQKVLIGKTTPLAAEARIRSSSITTLYRGMEIEPIEGENQNDWIKVKAFSNQEGWIPREILTDEVIFSQEEKSIPLLPDPAPASIRSTSPSTSDPMAVDRNG